MTLSRDEADQLLDILSDPALRNGGGDSDRAEIIRAEVFPALTIACHEFGLFRPDWLKPLAENEVTAVGDLGKSVIRGHWQTEPNGKRVFVRLPTHPPSEPSP